MIRNFFSVVGKGGLAAGAAAAGTAAVAANEFSTGPPCTFVPPVEPVHLENPTSKGSSLESSTVSINNGWIVHLPSPLLRSCRSSDSDDDLSCSSGSSSSILVESLYGYSNFSSEPLREEETDGAISTLRARSDLWRHMLPERFSSEEIDNLFVTVKSLTQDIGLISEAKKNIECEREKRVGAESCTWEALQEKFPCAICRDVLAAPVALPCSHSYCGVCLNNLFSQFREEEEVAQACPCCSQVLLREQDTIYERAFDQTIEKEVERVVDCEEKKDWYERRAAFQQLLKEREKDKMEEVQEEKESSHEWKHVTAFLVFLVISLIVAARKLH